MRLSAAFFALGLGLGLPSLAIALGIELSYARYFFLGMVGFCAGIALPAALDLLARVWPSEAASVIRQREANTAATEVATAERWAKLDAPVAEQESDHDEEREAWRLALDRFFRAGESAGGFSAGRLSGVAGSDAWPRLVHFYASESGGNVLRDAGGNVGHTWGHGWTLDRVMLALGNNKLPRPDMPLPVIQPFVAPATQRRAPQKVKTAVVIDN